MSDGILSYFAALLRHWIALMSGTISWALAVVQYLLTFYTPQNQPMTSLKLFIEGTHSALIWAVIGCLCFLSATFLAWREDRRKLATAESKIEELVVRPELSLRCSPDPGTVGNFILNIRNVGKCQAVNVKFSDLILPIARAEIHPSTSADVTQEAQESGGFSTYILKYDSIQGLVPGEDVIATYDVEGMGGIPHTGAHTALLKASYNSAEPICVYPVTITFSNSEGWVWTSEYDLNFDAFEGRAAMVHRRVRLISKRL